MSKKITPEQIAELSKRFGYSIASIKMIMDVEGAGKGFSDTTGKILIQFEPAWFKRNYSDWKKNSGTWINNGVNDQATEWDAFNNAFSFSPADAMKSTSIGCMQVMGFHFALLGFKTVGEMWDFAKVSEANQLELGLRFIKSTPALHKAVIGNDFYNIAYYYNGAGFLDLARRTNSQPYDERLKRAFTKYS